MIFILRNKQGLTEEEFLKTYDASKYERPSVTVDMLIFTIVDNKLKLLMIKRGDHPCIGQWALPGGFVNMDESLDEAAQRELKEETGIDNIYMEQVYTWGDLNRDPRTRIITVSYMALVDSSDLKVKADDDADDAEWFNVECTLDKEEKIDNTIDLYYKLKLTSNNNNLSAVVRVRKIYTNKSTKIQRDVIEKNNIAVDHSKIIQYALEVLKLKEPTINF